MRHLGREYGRRLWHHSYNVQIHFTQVVFPSTGNQSLFWYDHPQSCQIYCQDFKGFFAMDFSGFLVMGLHPKMFKDLEGSKNV
jgi:hypothetical protein